MRIINMKRKKIIYKLILKINFINTNKDKKIN